MTQCWSEGELRAYCDSELPPRDMDRVAAHLNECATCRESHAELSGRAGRLAALLDALPVAEPVVRMPRVPQRSLTARRWMGAAVGIAASLAIAFVLMPRRTEKTVILPVVPGPQVSAPSVPAPAPATVKPAIIRRVPRKRAVQVKPKPQVEYYVALDDEPIDTGVVVRVGLNGGQVPADVIVGPDGRAHAIRLVSDFSGEAK